MDDLGKEPHEYRPPMSSDDAKEVLRRSIQSDQIQRLQILHELRHRKQKGIQHTAESEFKEILGIDDAQKIRYHLETLEDLGLIEIGSKTTGGYRFIKITGQGVTKLETFFLKAEDEFRKSEDKEIKKKFQEIDKVEDPYLKHEVYIQTMMTIQEGLKIGNKLLSLAGLG